MASVDVKISQAVWNQNAKLDAANTQSDYRIGASIDQIVFVSHLLSSATPDSGKIAVSSGKVTVQGANGNTVTYAGTVQNPKASSGTAVVTSITQSFKGYFQETTKGSLNYSYQYSTGHLDMEPLGGKISSYKLTSLVPLDDLHGKGGWEVTGDITVNSDESYSGKIYSLSTFADKYMKSFKIVGDLNLNLPIGATKYQVSGQIDSISMLYADKSYLKVTGPIAYSDGQQLNDSMFSDPARWNGDDNMKFDLPANLGREITIDAGEGNDVISVAGGGGHLRLYGNAGDDRFILRDTLSVVEGGDGVDTIETAFSYSLGSASNVENLTLTGKGHVSATGNAFDNVIIGNAGNNVVDGAGGNDILKGGAGNDTYKADFSGNVTIDDVSGKDVLVLDGALWAIVWNGSTLEFSGTWFGESEEVDSKISIFNANKAGAIESIRFASGAYNFQIATTQTGGKKNDMVVGTRSDDVLKGLDGNDLLVGSYGNDVLVGGKGADLLLGGADADIFRLEKASDSAIGAEDSVLDFTAGTDKIDLTLLDANVKLKGVQAFTLSETGPASNAIWFVPDADGSGYALCGDVNGDATADFSIVIAGVSAPLASSDILGLV